MRQLLLPFYEPYFPAPERAVLTLLHAALSVTEHSLRDAHPRVDSCRVELDIQGPVVVAIARLIVGRCAELRLLLDLYDVAVDELTQPDDAIPSERHLGPSLGLCQLAHATTAR